jgi:hypothetical protein
VLEAIFKSDLTKATLRSGKWMLSCDADPADVDVDGSAASEDDAWLSTEVSIDPETGAFLPGRSLRGEELSRRGTRSIYRPVSAPTFVRR